MEETRLSPHTASEPFRPTVVVRNRYSTWPRGPFSRGRFPKRPRFPLAHARMPLYGHWWGCRATQVTWYHLATTLRHELHSLGIPNCGDPREAADGRR